MQFDKTWLVIAAFVVLALVLVKINVRPWGASGSGWTSTDGLHHRDR